MTNRITLLGRVLDTPKIRTFEVRDGRIEIVSLWIEVTAGDRADRFTVEVNCPKAQTVAKALPADAMAEISGVLRHDRWKDKTSGKWTGKVYVAIDPGAGAVRSKGMSEPQPDKIAA